MQEKCVACGELSPDVDSRATLTGEHGWRPVKHEGKLEGEHEGEREGKDEGEHEELNDGAEVEWRCPLCWQEYRDSASPASAWCADCGGAMPSSSPIDTSWTRYGWRARRSTGAGKRVVEFFCPACWRRKAAARGG